MSGLRHTDSPFFWLFFLPILRMEELRLTEKESILAILEYLEKKEGRELLFIQTEKGLELIEKTPGECANMDNCPTYPQTAYCYDCATFKPRRGEPINK